MPLHTFVSGESINVAENLDANFAYLLSLFQVGSVGTSTGTSTCTAQSQFALSAVGTATGLAVVSGISVTTNVRSANGVAAGVATVTGIGQSTVAATGTAAGSANVQAFSSLSTPPSVATAAGSATVSGVGGHGQNFVGTAAGSATVSGIGGFTQRIVGTAAGFATVTAIGQGSLTESPTGTIASQPSQTIIASTVPGGTSTSFNTFSLPANPGQVLFNGVTDTAASNANIVEIAYVSHTVYFENNLGNWYSWNGTNLWVNAASPFATPAVTESAEGTIVTTAGTIIYASSTPGTAAAATATVGNGLDTWALTANPGVLIRNGTNDANTSGVTEIYYHNHFLYQLGGGNWYDWTVTGTANGYTGPIASPVPTAAAINVNHIASQTLYGTITVVGNYQDAPASSSVNLVRDSTNVGAVAGTPGVMPTNWSQDQNNAGLTLSVIGFGAADPLLGLPYIDLNLAGTAVTAANTFVFDTSTGIVATPSTAYTMSYYVSTTNITNIAGIYTPWFETNSTGGYVTQSPTSNVNGLWVEPGTALTRYVVSSTTAASTGVAATTTAFLQPVLQFSFVAGAVNVTMRIAGVQIQTGSTATTFSPTPGGASLPSLQYSDNNSGTWTALPSPIEAAAGVTGGLGVNFSFVHPPTTLPSGSYVVSVRDAVLTGVVGASNPFQVSSPGVVNLLSITLSKTTATAGPAGTVIGAVVVTVSSGNFTGTVTVSGTNASSFSVTGGNLVTTAVLAAGSYGPITLTAGGQVGTVPSTLAAGPFTIVLGTESANGTIVTTVGPTVLGSATPGTAGSTLTWALIAAISPATGNQVTLNGVRQTAASVASGVKEIYYINHTAYIQTSTSTWVVFSGTITTNQATYNSSNSPIPIVTLTNVEAGTGLTQDDGQVSVVGTGGVSTDNFVPTPGTSQLFTIQLFVAGVALSFAAGPTSYTITGGANASSFNISNVANTSWYLNGVGALPAGTYVVTVAATY
jgi:fibronectin-binding autotransporter adhesin